MTAVRRSWPSRVLQHLNHDRSVEVWCIGYPKAGNTWVRFLLGRYVQLLRGLDELPLFDTTDRWGRCERFGDAPRMTFTHRPLEWSTQTSSDLTAQTVVTPFYDKRVLLLVRHPLDILVSLWMQRRYRAETSYSGELVAMLEDPVWGLTKCLRFYALWAEPANDPMRRVWPLRYEDMRTAPEGHFTAMLAFLGIPVNPGIIAQALSDASFDNMQRLESSADAPVYRSSGLAIFATGDRNQPDALHVRRGKIGGYMDYLDSDAAARYARRVAGDWPAVFGSY